MLRFRSAAMVAAAFAFAIPATAGALSFGPANQLAHGDPKVHPYWSGGEPSIAYDPAGDGHVYVSAPQFIPTGVDNALGAGPDADVGVGTWASADGGATFPISVLTGASNGGGGAHVRGPPG